MPEKNASSSGSLDLVITRTFAAPRELVWKAWTEQEHLLQWPCPNGFTLLFSEGELRVGGKWRSAMRSPEGKEHVMYGTYREISPYERLVFTHAWEENGLPGQDTIATVLLSEDQGKTTMIFKQSGFSSVELRDGHNGGWSQGFDHLALHLQHMVSAA